MVNDKVIQKAIDELNKITKVELAVYEINGRICASTFKMNEIPKNFIIDFNKSCDKVKFIGKYNFFKVSSYNNTYYIVITKANSKDANVIGEICVSQLKILIDAYREKYDINTFIENLILDKILLVDIYNRAKKIGIENNINRVIILIESDCEKDKSSLEMIKNIFEQGEKDFITVIDNRNIVILKEIEDNPTYDNINYISNILLDMFNTELMVRARISYGNIINDLKNVSKSYKEAKMSMEIGNIFFAQNNIIGYNSLGIGRLIYQLPLNVCKVFINEIFKEQLLKPFDDETITTVQKFFENNLNISETARKLYIHRNTLVYKLDKIQKTTGLDIKIFEDAVTFKLGIMIINYIKNMNNN